MPLSLNNLSTSSQNVLRQLQNIPANIFIENKQEDFITAFITTDLTKNIGTNSNYFITQYTGNGIQRADIAELNHGNLDSHIECKYLYSFDFKRPQRAKMNWAERELVIALSKLGKTNNDYILCYCIHITNINIIINNLIQQHPCLRYKQNIFTYIHDRKINNSIQNAVFKRTGVSIFNSPNPYQDIGNEINNIISAMTNSNVNIANPNRASFSAALPGNPNVTVNFDLILYAIEL